MIKKDNFFKGHFYNSKKYNKNFKKTKDVFSDFMLEVQNGDTPFLESLKKEYKLNFTPRIIKKFSKYKNIIIIGIGGSVLGTKSIYSFFKNNIKKKVFFFDNLDSNLLLKYKKIENLNNSCFVVVSKSGNTLETITNLNIIFSKKLIKNKLILITEKNNNSLMRFAKIYNAEIIEHKKFIGGRYSVLSESSMFPAALMGVNLHKFRNLSALTKDKNFVSSLIQNVASIYTLNTSGIRNSVILNYDSTLNDLGYWYLQLVAESLGKKGKGINPTLSFLPKDNHSLLQLYLDGPKDKFFTFFNTTSDVINNKINNKIVPNNMKFLKSKNLKLIINAQNNATKNIFKIKKIPFREINFNKKNLEELDKVFIFFILETIILARLMNINPFNQPAVEQIKIETNKFLR
jgi:glucose-6-phosphate isomerase